MSLLAALAASLGLATGAGATPFSEVGEPLGAPAEEAEFGASVALSADGLTMLVGAPRYPSRVDVYVRSTGQAPWTLEATLASGSIFHLSTFGEVTSVSGDGSTAIVGAPGEGKAFVFSRAGTSWSETGEISSGGKGSGFGASIALAKDGQYALIGAPDQGDYAGAVYAYEDVGGEWRQQGQPIYGGLDSLFGTSVSISAEGATALVGAPQRSGSATVLERDGTGWTQSAPPLVGTGCEEEVEIECVEAGTSVALSADGRKALVGAPGTELEADPGLCGAVFTFVLRDGEWQQEGEPMIGAEGGCSESFGSSVLLSGDGRTAVVMAPKTARGTGAAWVFEDAGGGFVQSGSPLSGAEQSEGAYFGGGSALTPDGDTLAVGGPYQQGGGAVWMYEAQSNEREASVSSVSPDLGGEVGGEVVHISGSGFEGATEVLFGGAPAPSFEVQGPETITAVTPAGKGRVDVTVETPAGPGEVTSSDGFTYLPPPSVSGLSPDHNEPESQLVKIEGAHFTAASSVHFGGAPASFRVVSDGLIEAQAPLDLSGTVEVIVTTAGGTSAPVPADRYTTIEPPELESVSPRDGAYSGGTEVTLDGDYLEGAERVDFGSTPASFHVDSEHEITATAPAGSGYAYVTITTRYGTSETGKELYFSWEPELASVSPPVGPADGGTTVTIRGSGLTGATAVEFGGRPAASYAVQSDEVITAVTPPGEGRAAITVSSPGGRSAGYELPYFYSAGPPEFGRCLPVGGAAAAFKNAHCDSTGSRGRYEWHPGLEGEPFEATTVGFGAKGEVHLATASGTVIACTGGYGYGKYQALQSLEQIHLYLTGCSMRGQTCTSAQASTGEIASATLLAKLGLVAGEEDAAGLELQPQSGDTIATFTCGSTPVTLKGAVVGKIRSDVMAQQLPIHFAEAHGQQRENDLVGEHPAELLLQVGSTEAAQAGLSVTLEQYLEEAYEVNRFT